MRSTHRSHNVLRGFILRRVQCIISFLLCTLSLRRQTFSGCLVAVVSPSSPLLSRNECPAEQWGPTRILPAIIENLITLVVQPATAPVSREAMSSTSHREAPWDRVATTFLLSLFSPSFLLPTLGNVVPIR